MQFQCNEMELIDWICFVLEPVNLCYREPCARCAGLRPADTATTGPTPASPARPSSGGMSVTEEWIDVKDISNRSK